MAELDGKYSELRNQCFEMQNSFFRAVEEYEEGFFTSIQRLAQASPYASSQHKLVHADCFWSKLQNFGRWGFLQLFTDRTCKVNYAHPQCRWTWTRKKRARDVSYVQAIVELVRAQFACHTQVWHPCCCDVVSRISLQLCVAHRTRWRNWPRTNYQKMFRTSCRIC